MGDAEYLAAFDALLLPIARALPSSSSPPRAHPRLARDCAESRREPSIRSSSSSRPASTRRAATWRTSRGAGDLSLTLLSLPPPLQAGGDRVGGMDLTAGGFAGMAARLRSLAGGRVVFALEGGYKPSLAAKGVLACVRCAPLPPLYRTPHHALTPHTTPHSTPHHPTPHHHPSPPAALTAPCSLRAQRAARRPLRRPGREAAAGRAARRLWRDES